MNLPINFSCNYTGVFGDFFDEGILSLKDLNNLIGIEEETKISQYLDDVVFLNYPNIVNKKKMLLKDLVMVKNFQRKKTIFYFKNTTEGTPSYFFPISRNGEEDYLFVEAVADDERFISIIEEESKYSGFINLAEINTKREKSNVAYFNWLGNKLIEEYPLVNKGFEELFVTNDEEIQKRRELQKQAHQQILEVVEELNGLFPKSIAEFCNFFISKGYAICLQDKSFNVFDVTQNVHLNIQEYRFKNELEPFNFDKLLAMVECNYTQEQRQFYFESVQDRKIEKIIDEKIQFQLGESPIVEEIKPTDEVYIDQVSEMVEGTKVTDEEQVDLQEKIGNSKNILRKHIDSTDRNGLEIVEEIPNKENEANEDDV